jgi:HEAT repeat protein
MTKLLGVGALLLFPAARAAAQEVEWIEIRFHRVHLRNGNFIDGTLDRQSPSQVVLKMKAGEMLINRTSIERVELVKMRTFNEKPKPVGGGIKPVDPDKPAKGNEGAAKPTAPLPEISDSVKTRVVKLLDRFGKTAPEFRYEVMAEILQLGEEAAACLAALLERTESDMRNYVTEILTVMKDRKSVPWLVHLLGHSDSTLRAQALLILASIEDQSVIPQVRPMLGDSEAMVRDAAIRCLQQLDDLDSMSSLGYLATDPNPAIRGRALGAVAELGRKHDRGVEVAEILMAALDRARGQSVADVAGALSRTGYKDAWPSLARLLDAPEPRVRSTAAIGLASLGAVEAGDQILQRMALEDDKRTRLQLGVAASRLKLRAAIPTFVLWLTDLDPEIKAASAAHLGTLTGQNFGSNADRWREWWDKSQPR